MSISIRQIRAFVSVARLGNFTRAAEALSLTQPALTVQIRGLEESLGIRLFDRTTRTVSLTRAGANALPSFERMLGELSSVMEEARDLAAMKRGVVRIATLPSVAAATLPRAINGFRARYPGATFVVQDLVADRVLDALREGTADLGITGGGKMPADLKLSFRAREAFHIILPRDHPLAQEKSATREAITRYPLVAMHPSTSVRQVVNEWLEDATQAPVIASEATYMMTVAGMVSAGLGIAVLPASAREVTAFPDLTTIPISDPPLTRAVSVVTLEGRSLSPMAESFCEHLIAELQE